MKICPVCGKELNDNAILCVDCGTEINQKNESLTDSSNAEKHMKFLFIGLILPHILSVVSGVCDIGLNLLRGLLESELEIFAIISLASSYVFSAGRIFGLILAFVGYFGLKKSIGFRNSIR